MKVFDRKPYKFLKKCPNIAVTYKAAISKVRTNNKILKNGNLFPKPIVVNGQNFMLQNTCPFDSIVQIVTCLLADSQKYLSYIENSLSETC